MATDLPDAQSSEDLAPQQPRRGELRGTVRAEGWAAAEKAKSPAKPRGGCGSTGEYSDRLLAALMQHDRQWLPAGHGMAKPWVSTQGGPRCKHKSKGRCGDIDPSRIG